MTPETHQTLRHASGIMLQRILEIGGGILFVALVPRLLGPLVYGQFSLLNTLSAWFSLVGVTGTASMMTRFVPRIINSGDHAVLRKLASGMMALRLVSGVAGVGAYVVLATVLLHVSDHAAVVMLALSIGIRTIANLPFTLFLGLNQAARWGVADTARASLLAPAVYGGYLLAGLRGSCGGLLLLEMVVLATGLWWSRELLAWSDFRIDRQFLQPYLRFSAIFFVSNIFGAVYRSAGGLAIHLISGGFVESGYFNLAFGIFAAATQVVRRLLNSFGPHFSLLLSRGDTTELKLWIERLMKVLAIASLLVLAVTFAFGDLLVKLLLGSGYAAVALQLKLLSVAGVLFIPGSVTPVLAVIYDLPRLSITAAGIQLLAFGLVCILLIPGGMSLGACWAVVCATSLFSAYSTWRIRQHLRYSLKSCLSIMALGAACSPLLLAWKINGLLQLVAYIVLFGGLLMLFRIVTIREVFASWDTLRRLRHAHPGRIDYDLPMRWSRRNSVDYARR
jgi:O-antigen/teichoic acid export membrane protein